MNEDLNDAELDTLAEIAKTNDIAAEFDRQHVSKLENLGYVEVRQHGVIATGKGRLKLKAAGRAES